MQFGRKAFISTTSVQGVLDTLVFSTTPDSDLKLLKHLFLVEKALLDPKTPDSDDTILYILQTEVVNIIVSQLTSLRERFQLESIVSESHREATESMINDSLTQSNDMIAWSILYYLYVQPDLGFTVDSIGEIIGVTARTIRRYRKYGIKLLKQLLWQKEDLARRNFHQKNLYNKLRFNFADHLGRDKDINAVVDALKSNQGQIIYVYGEKGIGKTSFIKACIYKLLGENNYDDVLWLDDVSDVDSTLSHLETYYSLTGTNISLSSLVSLFDCIFVFDDADELCKSDKIKQLMDQLSGATIFVSSTPYCVFPFVAQHHVQLLPLSDLHLGEIIDNYLRIDKPEKQQFIMDSNGNPERLHTLMKHHRLAETNPFSDDNFLLGLELNQRTAIAFIPKQTGLLFEDFELICQFFGLSSKDIELLLNLNIIYQIDNRIYCSIESDYVANTVKNLSDSIQIHLEDFSKLYERATIIRYILNYDVSFSVKSALVKQYWRDGINQGDKLGWHSLLMTLRLVLDETWLVLAIGVSHKHINHLPQAESTLIRAIEISGLRGEFEIQTEAILELIKVYRLIARYKDATHYLDRLNLLWGKYLPPQLLNDFLLEKAQLALDMNETSYALELANSIQSYKADLLQAECLYRLGNCQACLDICQNILSQYQLADVDSGIIHNLIGRCHQSSNVELSAEQYSLAIEYFRQSFSLLYLSRAQINLATTFIYLEELESANDLFNKAEEICIKVNDVVGLKTIEKNRAYIHRMYVSRYE